MARTTKKPEERRAELIATARTLFDLYGVKNVPVSQIVQQVGVAQGLFYYYFKSKDEVVDAVIAQVLTEIQESTATILEDSKRPFCQKLADYIDLYLQVIDQFLGDTQENAKDLTQSTHRNPLAQQAQFLLESQLSKLISQGCDSQDLTIAYPQETAFILLYGLLELSKTKLLQKEALLTILEQGLGLPQDALAQHSH